MPGFTDDSGVRAASRPDLREGKGALEALGEGDGAIRRRRAAGMPSVPLDEAAPRAGHDVRICRAFVTLSGYVPGHSIRAAPCADLATTRSSARLPLAPAHRGMKMAFEGSVRLGPNVWFIRDRGLLWENADG